MLGNYVLLEKIGEGGMGAVYKAQHRRLLRTVAIKMLPPAMAGDKAAIARFEREVAAAAKLRHPNIVAADDADNADGIRFLVMEYVNGDDLSDLVKKDGPLTVARATNFILQAARGLEFAHKKGVIHRDIKPGNLLLDVDGNVKILDMGLARFSEAGAPHGELTATGMVLGTPEYMAPEQALDTRTADARSDIYALGCTLYFLLSGRPLYSGAAMIDKLLAHQQQPIPSLQDVQSGVTRGLDAVFRKMVAKHPEDRFQSVTELIGALEALGIGGATGNTRSETAAVATLSLEERQRLSASAPERIVEPDNHSPPSSHAGGHWIIKLAGGAFATIIAPILVTFMLKYLEKQEPPPVPPVSKTVVAAASVERAATAPSTADATTPKKGESASKTSTPSPPTDAGKSITTFKDAKFKKWQKDVAGQPAEKQLESVIKKLQELNPGFDGKLTGFDRTGSPKLAGGAVRELAFNTDVVQDISPIRALTGLTALNCSGTRLKKGNLSDLSPLQGMKLNSLNCYQNKITELSPLRAMPLTELHIDSNPVADISPLEGMQLKVLGCWSTQVSDLSVLKGMPLTELYCGNSNVKDLSPLRDLKLKKLECQHSGVSDMSPLTKMSSLRNLKLYKTNANADKVAALQKALPDCKFDLQEPAKAKPK